uniref:G protein subunit alpha 13 n=1 Tax=Canis lupus familiaris TaxID=9615 RepID=A0A8P0SFV9_CANLF
MGRKTTDADFFRLTVRVYSFLMPAQGTGLPEVSPSLPRRAQGLSPSALDKSRAKVSFWRGFQKALAQEAAGAARGWEQPRPHVTRVTHPGTGGEGRRGRRGARGVWVSGPRRAIAPLPEAPGSPHFPVGGGRGPRGRGVWGASRDPSRPARGPAGRPPGIPAPRGRGHPAPRPLRARRAGSSAGRGRERTRTRAVPSPAPPPAARARARRPRPPPGTFNHVAVDGGAELLARALVEVLPVDDPHLLQEGGLAALARAQQQDLHQPLHVRLLPGQAFVDLLGLALLLGLAARQHAAGEAHGQHGPRRQEVRHLAAAAAAAASAGPSGSLHRLLLLGRRAAPATRLEGGERCGGPSAPGEGGNQRGDSQGGPGERRREGWRAGPGGAVAPARARAPPPGSAHARTHAAAPPPPALGFQESRCGPGVGRCRPLGARGSGRRRAGLPGAVTWAPAGPGARAGGARLAVCLQ